MNFNQVKILFVLSKSKTNMRGLSPLICRITFNNKRKEFSTGFYVAEADWNAKLQIVTSKTSYAKNINTHLNKMYRDILSTYSEVVIDNQVFDVHDIYNAYMGTSKQGILYTVEYFNDYLLKIKRSVGKGLELTTWKKFENSLMHLKSFIKWKYDQPDLLLRDTNLFFINEYEFYLKTVKELANPTIHKIVQRFKKVMMHAENEGMIGKTPFALHKAVLIKKDVVYLTNDDLTRLEQFELKQPRLKLVKDLFIFCCYTGLPYYEMSNLSTSNVERGFDRELWLVVHRKKTDKSYRVPLLPKAVEIMRDYMNGEGVIFPSISNQKFNSYLKEIADIVDIKINLTHHIARKTFASTVLLYNNVPMEVVSELLGHTSIKVTQESYAKLSNRRVSETMKRLSTILK